ncbi:MAG: hypothetical protein JOZ54_09960 [Acidobacteria bacterium]|nr:hypothetical protein [Acidobacteriota bacterium]
MFAGARALHTDVPTKGAQAIYARAGDVVAYGGATLFVLLLVIASLGAVRSSNATLVQEPRA